MAKTVHGSYSLLSTLALCPRKWQLSRRYEPKVKARALAEGDVFHQVLGKFYGVQDYAKGREVLDLVADEYLAQAKANGLSQGQVEALESRFAGLGGVASVYWDKIAQPDFKRFRFLWIEKPFTVRLSRTLVLHGYVDGVWEDLSTGVRYIVEHKYKSDHHEELMPLDLQVSLYTLALIPEFGVLPTLYNVARKPLQKRKPLESFVDFSKRIREAILSESEGFAYRHDEFESRFFVRQRYSRGKGDLEVALEQARAMAKAMKAFDRRPELVYRNVGEHCLFMCPFRSICLEEDPLVVEQFFHDKRKLEAKAKAVPPV